MPSQVPTMPDDPSLEAQKKAWEFYKTFEKPFLCAFSDNDPVTRGADRQFLCLHRGAGMAPRLRSRPAPAPAQGDGDGLMRCAHEDVDEVRAGAGVQLRFVQRVVE